MEIEWRRIGETMYSVSNMGFIRNDKTDKVLVGAIDTSGYTVVNLRINKKSILTAIHKMVAVHYLGFVPDGRKYVVNHKDSNKLNNRVDNLEVVTFRHNCSIERTIKSTSKYTGVTWSKPRNKWRSSIRINGKLKHLGFYKEEIDAHDAYQMALKALK